MKLASTVCGIPCIIHVLEYSVTAGSDTWDSDYDYYGDEQIEFAVLDRKGYPAPWLERKLTDNERERIEIEISEEMAAEAAARADDYWTCN